MASRPGHHNSVQTGLQQTTRVDPRLIVMGQVLQLNQAELETFIERELDENPALERLEEDTPITSDDVMRIVAPGELKHTSEDRELARSLPNDGQETSWVEYAASIQVLADHVLGQLAVTAQQEDPTVLHYLVGSLNERGYLACSVEEAALACGVSLEEAERALAQLHRCDPPGVGARDLRECLALQLAYASTDAERLARDLVTQAWDHLVRRNSKAIARKFRVSFDLAEEAFEVITNLQPYPADGFEHAAPPEHVAALATPDLRLTLLEQGWVVEVSGPSDSTLCVNRYYRQRLDQAKASHALAAERRHLSEYIGRAENFLNAILQRRQTLRKVGEYLIEHQDGFVRTGDTRFLKPLTRATIARAIGVHESTVSRATSHKFLEIATGEIVSFETLFKPALRIQRKIEEILATEHPDRPLSDAAIAKLLADQGIHVARRTVNKYRDKTRLLSSRRRRSA
ncbi:MAG: RNA polymerase factor sigma-54 [Fimbriimonadaceae bacterium]|nr:RNA polymerase factor sigma-54 [Fimbriimonadaceae bacterium]